MSLLLALLLVPVGCMLVAAVLPSPRAILALCVAGAVAVAGIAAVLIPSALEAPVFAIGRQLMLDALSAYNLAIVMFVFLFSSVYALRYFGPAARDGSFGRGKARRFGASWFGFLASMILVLVSNNVGLLWVAMETTTLASALLVCLEFDQPSVRASWTYLMICSVGIALALLGTFLLCGEARNVTTGSESPFLWTDLSHVASRMRPGGVKLAFLFLLVGYGTKAGLAPMHTWLPDAHSQAPTPVSAVLSGVLLNCALYSISRFLPVVEGATGGDGWAFRLLVPFGLVSIVVAAAFIAHEHDLKRLLAYCSVEHIGIIALGLGLGGTTAALFHTLNHSISKMVAFFCVGNLARDHGTRDTRAIGGLLKTSRLAGAGLLVAIFALVGMPPSSVFMSELWIARDGIAGGHLPAVVAFLLGVGVIFIVLLRPILGMAWAPAIAGRATVRARALDWPLIVLPLVLLGVLGLWMPEGLQDALTRAAAVLGGAP
jgi:hydrogenase-4 component F